MSKGPVLSTARAEELSEKLHVVETKHVNRRAEDPEHEVDQVEEQGADHADDDTSETRRSFGSRLQP